LLRSLDAYTSRRAQYKYLKREVDSAFVWESPARSSQDQVELSCISCSKVCAP